MSKVVLSELDRSKMNRDVARKALGDIKAMLAKKRYQKAIHEKDDTGDAALVVGAGSVNADVDDAFENIFDDEEVVFPVVVNADTAPAVFAGAVDAVKVDKTKELIEKYFGKTKPLNYDQFRLLLKSDIVKYFINKGYTPVEAAKVRAKFDSLNMEKIVIWHKLIKGKEAEKAAASAAEAAKAAKDAAWEEKSRLTCPEFSDN